MIEFLEKEFWDMTIKIPERVTLKAGRLILRPFEFGDVDDMVAISV